MNDKERLLTDFKEQISKMNEDLFSNLVTIEELKTVVCEKSSKITICENEISCLKKELHEKSQQVTNIRTSLNTTDKEKKKLETKIESLLAEVKQSNDIKLKEIEVSNFYSFHNVVFRIYNFIFSIRKLTFFAYLINFFKFLNLFVFYVEQ